MTTTIKRYEPDVDYIGAGDYAVEMAECDGGDYVTYDDHRAALDAERARAERAEAERDEARAKQRELHRRAQEAESVEWARAVAYLCGSHPPDTFEAARSAAIRHYRDYKMVYGWWSTDSLRAADLRDERDALIEAGRAFKGETDTLRAEVERLAREWDEAIGSRCPVALGVDGHNGCGARVECAKDLSVRLDTEKMRADRLRAEVERLTKTLKRNEAFCEGIPAHTWRAMWTGLREKIDELRADLARAERERDEARADKDVAMIEASQAIGRAERAEFNEEAQGRTLRAIVAEMRDHHPNNVGIVDAISRLVKRANAALAEVAQLRVDLKTAKACGAKMERATIVAWLHRAPTWAPTPLADAAARIENGAHLRDGGIDE